MFSGPRRANEDGQQPSIWLTVERCCEASNNQLSAINARGYMSKNSRCFKLKTTHTDRTLFRESNERFCR